MAVAQVSMPSMTLPVPVRSLASDLQHASAWVRRSLPFAWVPAAVGLALAAPIVGLLDGPAQWIALSVLASAVVWGQLLSYVAWSRSQQLAVSVAGTVSRTERTTADILRPLRKQGWKVVGDQIAVGPGGVVVLESKFRRTLTKDDLAWAATHVQRRQAAVAGTVLPVLGGAPVVPVIVAWGADPDAERPSYVDGVALVAGEELAAWLEVFGTERLTPTQVVAAWARLLSASDGPPAASAAAAA
jgi:hypothetical protein